MRIFLIFIITNIIFSYFLLLLTRSYYFGYSDYPENIEGYLTNQTRAEDLLTRGQAVDAVKQIREKEELVLLFWLVDVAFFSFLFKLFICRLRS
jgi:hypothetical protein